MSSVTVNVSPSVALIKYWGKSDLLKNIPATSSLALTLSDLYTETTIEISSKDLFTLNGHFNSDLRIFNFLHFLRSELKINAHFTIQSRNNFPTSAGFASSSSGFGALVFAINTLLDLDLSLEELSSLARFGSASAARTLFGGFTELKSGELKSSQLFDETYWPELRIIAVQTTNSNKSISSRDAMNLSKETSPFYSQWVHQSEKYFSEAKSALCKKNIEKLGDLTRQSTYAMFATMLSSTPPTIYWNERTMGVIEYCNALRCKGIGAWETMDAGPQVKILCLESDVEKIITSLVNYSTTVCSVGSGPRII